MTFKIISTTLLVIIASSLLIILAFKVKAGATADISGQGQLVSRGCCGNSGGGCAASR